MTNEELSRKIAAYFEPEPKWVPRMFGEAVYDLPSVGGFWRAALTAEGLKPHPRPITDPEISMRLLKWLLEKKAIVSIDFTAGHYEVACDSNAGDISFAEIGLTLEQAIALAVAKLIDGGK